ncbi:MAG: murI [Firmicutes bacterium]|nr:murI [Bacillota bacterium]
MRTDAPIGVFDSGIGGLTVVSEMLKLMPEERIIYFGDTARAPYGSRSAEEIKEFMFQILAFFSAQQVKMAVMACNTMTALGLKLAQEAMAFPVVGVNTGIHAALQASTNHQIGVIATEATIASGNHARTLQSLEHAAVLYPQACPKFVPLIEAGELISPRTEAAAQEYLLPLQKAKVDSLILGCTHYPFIGSLLRQIMGPNVTLIDPAKETAADAYAILAQQGMLAKTGSGSRQLCFSADLKRAQRMAGHVMDLETVQFTKIDLQDFVGYHREEDCVG